MAYRSPQEATIDLIGEERRFQDNKWREGSSDWTAWPTEKLAVLMEEVGEVAQAILKGNRAECFKELVQVAAVAVSWLETIHLDKGSYSNLEEQGV